MHYRVQIAVAAGFLAALTLAAQERPGARPGAYPRMGPPAVGQGRGQFPVPGRGDTFGRRPGEPRRDEHDGKKSSRKRWSGNIPPFLFDLAEKSPEEQEKFLSNSERFNRLPPDAQQNLRQRLKDISAMSPEKRAKLRERFEIFHRLPEESRDRIREQVFPVWNRIPDDRRRLVLDELRALRQMAPEARQQRLGSDEFNRTYSADERQVLQQLADMTPPPKPHSKRD